MLFNSLNFFVFFTVIFVFAWTFKRHARFRMFFLLGASLFFYMSWNWKYLGLILIAIILNYITGLAVYRHRDNLRLKKFYLFLSVVGSLSILGIFKYYNFFAYNVTEISSFFNLHLGVGKMNLLLPAGISFYTFQCLSYTIDIYREEIKPTKNIFLFGLYVSFFPQLVAGPIVRAKDLLPQLARPVIFDDKRVLAGFALIFVGLFKKIFIADILSLTFVDKVFSAPHLFAGPEILLAIYGYAFQIYCDFSGYSDVAIGAAMAIGYSLPKNFDSPYIATNIRDFWSRWHITLSTWLRDYLYIPLGGNRHGKGKTFRNLMATMLLGGLWHGAAYNFVIWGAYHGALVAITNLFSPSHKRGKAVKKNSPLKKFLKIFFTFHLVCFGWILFRSPNMEVFSTIMRNLFIWPDHAMHFSGLFLTALFTGFIMHFLPKVYKDWVRDNYILLPGYVQGVVYVCLLLVFTVLSTQDVPFIYFQF